MMHYDREGAWMVEGDPMEGALLAFASKIGIEIARNRRLGRAPTIPWMPNTASWQH